MKSAKSTRRVRLLARIGSPTCRAPDGEALALALLQVAPAHDRPPAIALEHATTRLDLVVDVGEAENACERACHLQQRPELPRVDIPSVAGDVPSAGEDETCAWTRVVEHRLSSSGRVPVHAPWDEHDEDAVAAEHGTLDDVSVVGRPGHDRDPSSERVELAHALLAAHGCHLVAAVERVLHHVAAELPGGPYDADLHRLGPVTDWSASSRRPLSSSQRANQTSPTSAGASRIGETEPS